MTTTATGINEMTTWPAYVVLVTPILDLPTWPEVPGFVLTDEEQAEWQAAFDNASK